MTKARSSPSRSRVTITGSPPVVQAKYEDGSATLPAWRRPVLALLWLIAGGAIAVALPDLFYDVFRSLVAMVVGQPLTLSRIAVVLTLLCAATWSTIVYAMRAE